MAHDEKGIGKERVDILHLVDQAGLAGGTQGRVIRSGTQLLYDNGTDWVVAA